MSKTNNKDFYNIWLIQRFFCEESLYSMDLTKMVLGMLKNLKEDTVTYYKTSRSDHKTNKGKIVSVRGNVITFLVKNRRYKYSIYDIWAYHPAIYAALCTVTGYAPHLKYKLYDYDTVLP